MTVDSIPKEQDPYPFENFSEVIRRNAFLYQDDEAFVIGSDRVTYADFNKRVNRVVHALREAGCKKGDFIGIMSMNCMEYLEVYGAAMKGGYILTHLSPRFSKRELEDIVSRTDIKVLFCTSEFSETVRAFRHKMKGLKHSIVFDEEFPVAGYKRFLEEHGPDEIEVALKAGDPLTVLFSRGTTGPAKGALYTHGQKLANSVNRAIELDVRCKDRNLVVLPISHIAGESHLWPFFLTGGCSVIMEEIVFNPLNMLRIIHEEKITDAFIFSPQLVTLLKTPNFDRYNIGSLKRIWYSGIPIPLDILERGIRMLGPVFLQGYGTTEAGPDITLLSREDHAQAFEQPQRKGILSSCGKPSLGVQVRIVDDKEQDLPPGEKGEIIARSDHLMSGYWGKPEETRKVMRNDWFYTGDTGFQDENGYIYLADRKEDIINIGGENISSKEIEDVLKHYYAVSDAAVIGVPDSDGVEHILGVVVLIGGAEEVTADDIVYFCNGRIEQYKFPERIEFITVLPKSTQGTILKRELRKRFSVWMG